VNDTLTYHLQPPKAGKTAEVKAIPKSFAECDAADQALVNMRDVSSTLFPLLPLTSRYMPSIPLSQTSAVI